MVCQEDDARRELLPEGYSFTSLRDALRRSLDEHGAGTTRHGDIQAGAVTDPA